MISIWSGIVVMSKYIDYRYMYYKRLQNIKVNFKVRTKIFLASTIT